MREFVTAIKIEFSEAGVVSTLGVATRSYFQSLTGLVNRTWYPILKSGLSYRLELALPWDSGTTTQDVGDIILHNGGDAQYQYILDRLISGQVAGLNVDARRGYTDQAWEDLSDRIFVSQSSGKRFDGEELILPQRSKLAKLQQPIITEVFDETTPNPRLVNKTVPYLIGPAFQLEGMEFDAANQQYYIAKNLANVSIAREGGARTGNFAMTDTGVQMLAGVLKQLTFDAIGPAPADVGISQTTVVDWDFSAWTSDDPDSIDVTENPPEAEISANLSGVEADITVQATPTGDTGWLSLTSPFEPIFATLDDNSAWTVGGTGAATVEDAVVADDGSWAEAKIFGETTLRVAGFSPAVPAGYAITGVEVELIAESDNDTTITVLTINQTNPGTRVASFIGTTGSGILEDDLNGGAKTTLTGGGTNFIGGGVGVREDTVAEDVNPGAHFTLKVKPRSTASETIKIYQVRAKFHYRPSIDLVRLFSPTAVLEPGERHTVTITEQSADIYARFGGSPSSGGALKDASDPFSTSLTRLDAGGIFQFDFVPEKDQVYFGIEFKRLNSAGTATIDRIKVEKRADGRNKYKTQVPYVAGLVGIDTASIDQDAVDAHDDAAGSPEMGWYVRGNESMTEWLDLTARRSLSGVHWVGRDGKLRSMLWSLPADATPDYRIENVEVDGVRQRTRIVGRATLQSEPAPMATERAVGARNWRPLRFNETAGITETFTPQDRANVTEDWRVRRRANFTALNPWTHPEPFVLELASISPTTGSTAGGDEITATGTFDTGQAISFTVDGVAATGAVVDNATTARFTTPAGTAGAVDIVATQGAQNDTLVAAFTYAVPSVALDISGATYSGNSFSTALQENQLKSIYVKPDGMKFYAVGYAADTVFQYSMSTAWDLSTASYDSVSKNVSAEAKQPDGLEFKPDGTKMYVSSLFPLGVFQYTLSTAWDVSTATYDSVSYPSTETSQPTEVRLSPDGTKMYILSAPDDKIYGYTLSTAWNVSTASLDGSFTLSSQDGNPLGMFINGDGKTALMAGNFTDSLYQYSFGTDFDITTLSYDSVSVGVAAQTGTPASPIADAAAGKMLIIGHNEDALFEYDL